MTLFSLVTCSFKEKNLCVFAHNLLTTKLINTNFYTT